MALLDGLGIGNLINVKSLISNGANVILMIMLLLVIVALVFVILDKKKYIHKFRIKDVINNRIIISDARAKEFLNKDDGAFYWKLASTKQVIPIPPPEAIEVDKKGHKCVEAFKLPTGEFVYGKNTIKFVEPPEEILNIKNPDDRKAKMDVWIKDHPADKTIDATKLLSTNSRAILINQIKKAHMRKTKKLSELLPQIAALAAITIIVVSLMIFYGDMGKPLLQMAEDQKAWQNTQLQIVQQMNDMKQNIQSINQELGNDQQQPAKSKPATPPS